MRWLSLFVISIILVQHFGMAFDFLDFLRTKLPHKETDPCRWPCHRKGPEDEWMRKQFFDDKGLPLKPNREYKPLSYPNLLPIPPEMEKLQDLKIDNTPSAPTNLAEARRHNYQFWQTQPVPKIDEKFDENTFIKPPVDVDLVQNIPFTLPDSLVWSDIDIKSDIELDELYNFLYENYVADSDNMFRLDYSREFLRYALLPPGWLKKWHVGVRDGNGKLVAFFSAVPSTIRVYEKIVKMVEYNFLCVHVEHRNKRITPILYREIARRANQEGIFQAAFTAGIVIPKPVGICRYYHRSLNSKKLIETRFLHLPKNKTMETVIKTYKLPEETKTSGLTELTPRHLDGAYQLLTDYLKKFDFVPKFEREEFDHFFLPRKNVAYSYVVEKDGKVTDMISFFNLSYTVLRHPIHKQIRVAYSFYNVATTTSLVNLMEDALILAQRENFDVFNALDLMENRSFFDELKFGIGSGEFHYYLYNWKCPDIEPKNVGLVLF